MVWVNIAEGMNTLSIDWLQRVIACRFMIIAGTARVLPPWGILDPKDGRD